MKLKPVFTFHTDPGHGWLEVSVSGLESVGFTTSDFSSYSYRSGSRVYLEEDCDAPKFIHRLTALGIDFGTIERNSSSDSFVRRCPSIY